MNLIKGNLIAQSIGESLTKRVKFWKEKIQMVPKLAVILVGDRIDSFTYVRMKEKAAHKIGIDFELLKYNEETSEEDIHKKIIELNNDKTVNGIIVQLPLPKHMNEERIGTAIKYDKDVDGFHIENVGRLALRRNPAFVACTPKGCIELLKKSNVQIEGKKVTVIGRSNIIGLPISLLLLHENATVTICHSKTPDIKNQVLDADIIIAAVGKPLFIKKDWIKPGAVVIDVGINSIPDKTKIRGYRLVGDVDFENVKKVAGKITPVPGGVGPMTVMMLIKSTIEGFEKQNNLINKQT